MTDPLFSEMVMGKNNKNDYDRPRTKNGYYTDEVRSALNKAIRRGDEESAFFWAYEFYQLNWWRYLVRTLVTIAGEDIGLANPQAMHMCMTAYLYFTTVAKEKGEKKKFKCKNCGNVEETKGFYRVHWNELGLLISYLCHSPKNRFVDYLTSLIDEKRKRGWRLEIPTEALDSHTRRGRERLKKEELNPDREFYSNGAKVKNHKYFNKQYEKKVKSELMKLLKLDDLIEDNDELKEH